MTRTATEVKAAELRAQLAAGDSGSRLEKALADGRVEILHSAPGRNRRATGEHAEYYPGEEKILLYGGSPLLVDSQRGSTKGNQLTWFANNDRLLVDGREDQPAMSRILRK
jgi:lipopolysaccharide export system protein LptA